MRTPTPCIARFEYHLCQSVTTIQWSDIYVFQHGPPLSPRQKEKCSPNLTDEQILVGLRCRPLSNNSKLHNIVFFSYCFQICLEDCLIKLCEINHQTSKVAFEKRHRLLSHLSTYISAAPCPQNVDFCL